MTNETWANLDKTYRLSPRELYEDEDMERLQYACRREVNRMSKSEKRFSLSEYIRDVMLSEEALAHGGGWEDVLQFLDWIDGGME